MVEPPGAIAALRSRVGTSNRIVYAVYHASEPRSAAGEFPNVNYAIVVTYEEQGKTSGLALLVGKDGLVGIDIDCGYPPEQMAQAEHFGEAVLPPP
jgi:hypothetical protein